CLAWVQREVEAGGGADPAPAEPAPAPAPAPAEPAAKRQVPDAECLLRFVFPESTYLRTDGAPDAKTATCTIETIADGHAHHEAVSKAGVERLRYYDLPQEWWSRFYHARMHSQAPSDRRHFQTITVSSTKDDPYVIGLDD